MSSASRTSNNPVLCVKKILAPYLFLFFYLSTSNITLEECVTVHNVQVE